MQPMLFTLKDAVAFSGFSRSRIYALAGLGEIATKKAGRRTLIVAKSLQDAIERLPAARITRASAPHAKAAMTRETAA